MTQQDAELVAHLAHQEGLKNIKMKEVGGDVVVTARRPKSVAGLTFTSREQFEYWAADEQMHQEQKKTSAHTNSD